MEQTGKVSFFFFLVKMGKASNNHLVPCFDFFSFALWFL